MKAGAKRAVMIHQYGDAVAEFASYAHSSFACPGNGCPLAAAAAALADRSGGFGPRCRPDARDCGYMGGEGACIIVAAVDERQAGIVLGIARRMVELNDELASCVQIFKDKLMIPSRGASFTCLPATPASLEGLDYTLAICDEIGRIDREVWTVIALAANTGNAEALTGMNRTPLIALTATALAAALAGCVVPGKAPAAPTATVTSTISAGTPATRSRSPRRSVGHQSTPCNPP